MNPSGASKQINDSPQDCCNYHASSSDPEEEEEKSEKIK